MNSQRWKKVGLNDPAFLEKNNVFLHKRASDPKFLATSECIAIKNESIVENLNLTINQSLWLR